SPSSCPPGSEVVLLIPETVPALLLLPPVIGVVGPGISSQNRSCTPSLGGPLYSLPLYIFDAKRVITRLCSLLLSQLMVNVAVPVENGYFRVVNCDPTSSWM